MQPPLALLLLFAAAGPVAAAAGQAAPSGIDVVAEARVVLDASYPPGWRVGPLLARIEKTVGSVADSPLAEVLVQRWIARAKEPGTPAAAWDALGRALDGGRLHGLAALALRRALSDRLRDRGELDAAREMSPVRDYVGHAIAIGPFGDAGSLFHGVRYPPEYEAPKLDRRYDGRFGRVGYRLVSLRENRTRLDLAPLVESRYRAGCHYAIVQVRSPVARDAWVEVTCAGSFEGWWNGGRTMSVNRFVEKRPLRGFFPARLRKGWNRLLFKTTAASTATVALRLVGAKGRTIDEAEVEPGLVIHPVAAAAADEKSPPPFRTAAALAESWIEASGSNPVVLALAGNLAARAQRTDVGLDLAKRALAKGGDDPTVRAACLETWRMARHVPADVIRTELRRLLDPVDPTKVAHRHLFRAKVVRLFADDRKEEALRLLDDRLADHPNEVATLDLKRAFLDRLHWGGEARRVLEKLAALAPHHVPWLLALARLEDAGGNPGAALGRVEKELAVRPGRRDLLGRALSLSRKVGDRARIDRYLTALYRDDPERAAAVEARAGFLADGGDWAGAAARIEELAKKRRDAALHKQAGDLRYLAGDRAAALAQYRRSLSLRPEQHGLRSWILRTAGVPEFAECKPFELDALAEVAAYQERAEDAASPSTLVLDQMVIRVYRDGSQMEETHILRRINDHRGVQAFEQAGAAARADELLELRTIRPDGRWFTPHRVGGTFSMPRLAPGVFVEEHYREYKPSPVLGPIDFVRFFFRGVDEPHRMSRLVVLLPKDQDFGDFVRRNFAEADVTQRDMDDLTAYIFLKKDMAKIDREVGMPPIEEIAPWVTFGKDRDLVPFLREQRMWFDHMTIRYLEIRRKAAELCAGLDDDRAKARAIHDFVHTATPDVTRRYGSPDPVSVLLKGEGDRFALQLALLRCAGVPWVPALFHPIPPEMDLNPEPFLDNPTFFAARAARVRPRGSAPFWIFQGTPRYFPFAREPAVLRGRPLAGCPYLLLEGNAATPGAMPGHDVRDLADVRVRARVSLAGGRARVAADIGIPAEQGYRLREQVRTTDESRRQLIARQIAKVLFPGFTLRKADLFGLEKDGEPLSLRLHLERRRFVEHEGSDLAIPPLLPPSRLTRTFGGRGRREHPLVWSRYRVTDWEVRIDPGAHRFRGLPRGVLVRRMLFDYGLSFRLDGHDLVVHRISILRPARVPPERYKEFLDLCRRIDDAESRRIRLAR